jgi:uncharacterized repeat protein (TIGR03803 family)
MNAQIRNSAGVKSATTPRSRTFRKAALVLGTALLAASSFAALPVVESPIYRFTNSVTTGGSPKSRLIFGSDGALYGTTCAFGPYGFSGAGGSVFKINRDGSGFQVIHAFGSVPDDGGMTPYATDHALALGTDHFLYGTTYTANAGFGAVFKLAQDGSSHQIIHNFDFSQGDRLPVAGVIQAANGALYGTTSSGAVFKLNTDGSGYTVLTNAGGPISAALLEGRDGMLYGTSAQTIFKIDPNGSNYTTLHTFSGPDGTNAVGQLVESSSGFLFGTTAAGGAVGHGIIFMLNTNGSSFIVVHNFDDGQIPGDGEAPSAGLAPGPGDFFYGTTAATGNAGAVGTVFKINQDGSGYERLYTFTLGTSPAPYDARTPFAGLVAGQSQDSVGVLYGTTINGGAPGADGAIFAVIVNPPLSITPVVGQSGNQPLVFWPAWAANYVLQTTTNLGSPAWTVVSNGVPMAGMLVTNVQPAAYYRLVWPQ